jgi:alpha-beta hydrolase superfamily lysophospholipase
MAARAEPAIARSLGAGRAWRVLYHSVDQSHRDIAVSGLVLVPAGHTPSGGWPVVAWAHGTTGLADQCAPSLAPRLGNDPTAVREVRALLQDGLAVVASDYPGLGSPGVHPYLIGAPDASAVIDSVTAAHALTGVRLSPAWVAVGHSEGGQTALFVAQAPIARLSRWHYLGTVAIAPASHLDLLIPLAEGEHDPVEQAYMLYALEGLSTVEPNVHVTQLLTPQARPVASDFTSGCIDDITNDLRRRHLAHLLQARPAAITALSAQLGAFDDPGRQPTHGAVLIVQGTTDQDVPEVATDTLVTTMCDLGDHVDYRLYPGRDHGAVVSASFPLVRDWIAARLNGRAPPGTRATSPRSEGCPRSSR